MLADRNLYHHQFSNHSHSLSYSSLGVRRVIVMRFVITSSAIAVVAARAAFAISEPLSQQTDHGISVNAQEIEVVEANKTYVVKLECAGCPFAIQNLNGDIGWQQPQDNALVRENMITQSNCIH
jgi:hypothetical protein